ncbi:MAG TPA: SDR family oxidoreductase [Gaiellaceae bacterium]|nr:SDR family oxidoreductase [Gaiellaceae bacterium]
MSAAATGGRLAGKDVLVTGAARGIGRALALGVAAEGARVHVADIEPPDAILDSVPQDRRGLALTYDISSTVRVRELFGRLERLDVLVNCAGVTGWIDLDAPSEEIWDRVLDTNLKGTFFCTTSAVPLLRAGGGGSIVNISSVLAIRGITGLAAYAASKGGINSLTVHLAGELAPAGIRVNAVAPGATNVERNLRDDPDYAESWAPNIPLGRIAEPEELVGPTVFLASDEAAQVTGQVIYVDGGWTATSPYPRSYVESATR